MSTTGSNKAWIGIVAGAAALIGAAVIFHYATSGKVPTSQVFDEIDALGPAKKEMNGMLSFMYYKDVFAIIQRHAKGKFSAEKKQLMEKRRRLLKENNMGEYKELVKEMISKEEQIFGELL
jgi:hypothetical protein